jgi:topoisomerase-4 subunit A
MVAEFALTDRQAEAILNLRLRSLRRLEEMQLTKEQAALQKERDGLAALLESPVKQRSRLKKDLAALRTRYGPETPLGARRTTIREAGPTREIPLEAMIEREPITVVLSQRGWIRALRGHVEASELASLKYKEGDGPAFGPVHAQTTDRILLFAADGRAFTLPGDRLPGGRGFGEPVRLMIDLPGETPIVAMMASKGDAKLLLAASDGRGFVTQKDSVVSETRKGRQLMNLRPGARLKIVREVLPDAKHIAVIGDNRKLIVFPIEELPELGRGTGVQMQRYGDGGLSDAVAFRFEVGLSWAMGGEGGRTRTETDLTPWRAARGAAGRMPPNGFPRDNRF